MDKFERTGRPRKPGEIVDWNKARQKRGLPEAPAGADDNDKRLDAFVVRFIYDFEMVTSKQPEKRRFDQLEMRPPRKLNDEDIKFILGNAMRTPNQYEEAYLYAVAKEYRDRKYRKE